ncbi:MAG: molybdopterin molybdotransferase MoeA [Anaerolineae bacterium]|nr:molybdopterin molybdotransferase MoeA [Anaerolineae bacterium]MDW8299153.1 molybdopterin molybdotransferase MoeA [Anaerolineae bacterium]
MYSVDEALERILRHFAPLPTEHVRLEEAFGRVLAQPIHATHDLPPFPNSALDGYAVRAADVATASSESPVRLPVIGDIPAGSFPQAPLRAGTAMRIMTGAPLPEGADAVVPVEQTDDAPSRFALNSPLPESVLVRAAVPSGNGVRPVGEDVRAGALVLSAGRRLRAADVGILAGLGMAHVPVVRRPVVAILSTGDELLPPHVPLAKGKIHDMNGVALCASVQELGCVPRFLGIASDSVEAVYGRLQAAADCDVIISTAGVSVGALDVVKEAITRRGTLSLWRVNIRPGKPLAFGDFGGVPFFGLPGNPVSALVTFDVFVRPALLKLLGIAHSDVPQATAEVAEPMNSDGRRTYARVKLQRAADGRLLAFSTGTQSSGAISSLVNADGLLIIPESMTEVPVGTRLPVRLFNQVL